MLFGKKRPRDMEEIVNQIRVDLSNNYKDNAVEGIKKLRDSLGMRKLDGSIKADDANYYEKLLEEFEADVQNFKRTY